VNSDLVRVWGLLREGIGRKLSTISQRDPEGAS
jgi:hypothetical protein